VSNQIVPTRVKGTRKRGIPRIRWTVEVEEDLKIIGIIICYTMARDRKEWRRIVLEAKIQIGKKNKKNLGIHACDKLSSESETMLSRNFDNLRCLFLGSWSEIIINQIMSLF
jgi:hypothetical protein